MSESSRGRLLELFKERAVSRGHFKLASGSDLRNAGIKVGLRFTINRRNAASISSVLGCTFLVDANTEFRVVRDCLQLARKSSIQSA